jgi:hypothetical protein
MKLGSEFQALETVPFHKSWILGEENYLYFVVTSSSSLLGVGNNLFWLRLPISFLVGQYLSFLAVYTRVYPKLSGLAAWSEN